MMHEEVKKYRELSGDTNPNTPISRIGGYLDGYDKALEQTRWIPVSERLPEEDGEYLLFGKIDEDEENYIFLGDYDSCCEKFGIWQAQYDRSTLGCLGSEFYEYASVTAWMPLPKPYKAESEE